MTPEEVAAELATWPEGELRTAAVWVDRSIKVPIYAITREAAGLSAVHLQRMRKKKRGRSRCQCRMARWAKDSWGLEQGRAPSAQCQRYPKDVRQGSAPGFWRAP